MVQLHDVMLSIHGSWATAAWYKIHQSADLPSSKLSAQDESLLSALSSTSITDLGKLYLMQQDSMRPAGASTREVPTPAQTRGKQLGLDSLQDGCKLSRLKKYSTRSQL